jgi:hypothetical protein
VKFFFPDSQDLVDPSFDFEHETRSEERVRQRDDLYAHEVFTVAPYDGLLVSKAIVDGTAANSGKYTLAQRHRLFRLRARNFFRLPDRSPLEIMGDCGAFSYVAEERPPYTVDEVIDFYLNCDFDAGLSVDHVILQFNTDFDSLLGSEMMPAGMEERQAITLELAEEFIRRHRARKCRFVPVGVAQGWSPESYALAVSTLQRLGYTKIAFGGMVPLKTSDIRSVVERSSAIRGPSTRFHLLGITRIEHIQEFERYGVTSFDTTSPLRRAFKDDKENYFTAERSFTAIRVPQADGNTKLQRRIVAGQVDQALARRLEKRCLHLLNAYDREEALIDDVLEALHAYEVVYDGRTDRTETYRDVLEARPWDHCPCDICRSLGINVILFRGAERNRRRGFHNLYVFYQRLHKELAAVSPAHAVIRKTSPRARSVR